MDTGQILRAAWACLGHRKRSHCCKKWQAGEIHGAGFFFHINRRKYYNFLIATNNWHIGYLLWGKLYSSYHFILSVQIISINKRIGFGNSVRSLEEWQGRCCIMGSGCGRERAASWPFPFLLLINALGPGEAGGRTGLFPTIIKRSRRLWLMKTKQMVMADE